MATISYLIIYTGDPVTRYRNLWVSFCLRPISQESEGMSFPQAKTPGLAFSTFHHAQDQEENEKVMSESISLKAIGRLPSWSTPDLLLLVLLQSGPHRSRSLVSPHLLLGKAREHTTKGFLSFYFLPWKVPIAPTTRAHPCFPKALLFLDPTPGGPYLGGWVGGRGAWSCLQKLVWSQE